MTGSETHKSSSSSHNRKGDISHDDRVAIRTLFLAGFNAKQIAKQPNMPAYRTVARVVQVYKKTGQIDILPRSGRPRITSHKQDLNIYLTALKNRQLGTRRLKPVILQKLRIRISRATLNRRMREANLRMLRGHKVPQLNRIHCFKRCYFAVKEQERNWKRVIFSDEKRMVMVQQHGYFRLRPHEEARIPTVAHPKSIMLWGCFSSEGTSQLIVVRGRINHQKYIEILQEGLLPFLEKYPHQHYPFIHDNARPHIPIAVHKFLRTHHVYPLLWPPNSPDLNLIENLWSILQQRVWEMRPTSEQQLIDCCMQVWNNISHDELTKLITTMPRRLKGVLLLKGSTLPRSLTGHIHHKLPTRKVLNKEL